jgi:serine protease inhibitor
MQCHGFRSDPCHTRVHPSVRAAESTRGQRSGADRAHVGYFIRRDFISDSAFRNLGRTEEDLSLTVADRVWAQKGFEFREDYLTLLRKRFRAPLSELDFAGAPAVATLAINQWASDETHGRIPRILEGTDPTTRMVLANAVYLKAKWISPFEGGETRDDWFTTPAGQIKTKTMQQLHRLKYAEVRGAKLLELPYQGAPLSMVIVLPDSHDGLARIEERLASSYADWIQAPTALILDRVAGGAR